MVELKVGDRAPDFDLMDEHGLPRRLKDYQGKSIVVLYFYPKDFTSGCTTEACSFRDDYEIIKKRGAVVIGVSLDSVESHAKFSDRYTLPFSLLSDSNKEAAKAYGVLGLGGLAAKRTTYIIDKNGNIAAIFPKVDVKKHAQEIVEALDRLK